MNDDIQPLLFSRRQAARRLGISIPTVIQLEREGKLQAIKLRGRLGSTLYRASEVDGLALGDPRPRTTRKREEA